MIGGSDNGVPSGLPDFTLRGVTFQCRTVGAGGAAVFVWRTPCGRAAAGLRTVGPFPTVIDGETEMRMARVGWARLGGELLGKDYPDLKAAMEAAVSALEQARAAA